jgi:cell division protein FtsW (lipid II flippase)
MRELENAAPFLIIPLVALTLYIQPLGTAMIVIGLGAVLYALTKSKLAFLAVLIIAPLSGMLHHVRLNIEAFQARDPVNVQTRLESVKTPAPLNPKNEYLRTITS